MTTPDLPDPSALPTAADAVPSPAPKKRGRPRKNPPPDDAAPVARETGNGKPETGNGKPATGNRKPETADAASTPAPKKRGRPRKTTSPDDAAPETGKPETGNRKPETGRAALVDAETATFDAYQREEPLPADDAASAPSGAPIAEDQPPSEEPLAEQAAVPPEQEPSAPEQVDSSPSSPAPEMWSPPVKDFDGTVYLPAESATLPAPKGEEWSPDVPPAPAPAPIQPETENRQLETGNRKPETFNSHAPYPPDADPVALAASVQPSALLKAALAGQRLNRFEIHKLTRRERAYLRAVQHGATIDYATFVARGIASAQQANAKAAAQPTPQGGAPRGPQFQGVPGAQPPRPVQPAAPRPVLPPLPVAELQALDSKRLMERTEELGLADDLPSLQKHDVVYELLRQYVRRGGSVLAEGILEIARDGSGFLRNRFANYHPCPEDAQVPQPLIRRHALRPGDLVVGPCKAPPENAAGKNRYFVLTAVDSVNGLEPALARRITPFENQTPLFPDRRIVLETAPEGVEMRIVDLFTPIGFGQRGLIVAPPRTGKTVIMQKMANAITANYPDAYLIVLLIDERPEEVTDMQRTTKAHVISSTFDEPAEHHVQVADLVIEMARRKVEMGTDVIILLDSITRLARAYNTLAPTNGRILSGGVEATALQKPKRFFGSARNLENGGSLTIIATALVETGSRMDEVIFEEFKGTGNMELVLDRTIADKRIFPAINIARSGTRKEDLLVGDPLELARVWFLRRAFSEADSIAATAMEELKTRLRKFPTNHDFLMGLQS